MLKEFCSETQKHSDFLSKLRFLVNASLPFDVSLGAQMGIRVTVLHMLNFGEDEG
jgi:hypothetical protein